MIYENINFENSLQWFIYFEYHEYFYKNINVPGYLTALDGALNCTLHNRLKPMNEMIERLKVICRYYSLSDSLNNENEMLIEDVRQYVLKPYWKDIQDACDLYVDECNYDMHKNYPKLHFEI